MLICPACQGSFDWMADLDQCSVCGGVHLVRRLGEIECRDCGMVGEPAEAGGSGPGVGSSSSAGPGESSGGRAAGGESGSSLADDVERALERVLGRSRRTAGIR
ncbi:MAG: hypothetical protein ABJB47_23125 [Actinomycetota bacterium]